MATEFEQLAAKLHELEKKKKKKEPIALLLKKPEEEHNGHADDDVGCLAKALQTAHAAGAITGAQANYLDLLARQKRLPDSLRTTLLSIGGEK
jgi:hypothetical protein